MLEYSISLEYTPPPSPPSRIPHNVNARVNNPRTTMAFWKNGSFVEHVLWEISGACVDTKLTGIEATGIISSDRE